MQTLPWRCLLRILESPSSPTSHTVKAGLPISESDEESQFLEEQAQPLPSGPRASFDDPVGEFSPTSMSVWGSRRCVRC